MIGISKLYCGTVEARLMRLDTVESQVNCRHTCCSFSKDKKPVVVWNIGRRCNLKMCTLLLSV